MLYMVASIDIAIRGHNSNRYTKAADNKEKTKSTYSFIPWPYTIIILKKGLYNMT